MIYENAMTAGCDSKAAREMRAHERSVQGCHEELHKLEALLCQADDILTPVTLPATPTTEGGKAGQSSQRPASSDVVNAVDSLRDRLSSLNTRFANLLGRVQV